METQQTELKQWNPSSEMMVIKYNECFLSLEKNSITIWHTRNNDANAAAEFMLFIFILFFSFLYDLFNVTFLSTAFFIRHKRLS